MDISQKTLEAILNYLATKPYKEVFQLISMVQKDIEKNIEKEGSNVSGQE